MAPGLADRKGHLCQYWQVWCINLRWLEVPAQRCRAPEVSGLRLLWPWICCWSCLDFQLGTSGTSSFSDNFNGAARNQQHKILLGICRWIISVLLSTRPGNVLTGSSPFFSLSSQKLTLFKRNPDEHLYSLLVILKMTPFFPLQCHCDSLATRFECNLATISFPN